jgi:adenosylcobyric acid synthase
MLNVALVLYPYASNLDEFDPLLHAPGVNVVPIRGCESLERYAAILLPGSKNVVESLRTLHASGLDEEVRTAAARGTLVFGVCGGMQLLGRAIRDPERIESGDAEGLGLLDLETMLAPDKVTRQRATRSEDGARVRGYEIHHGVTTPGPGAQPHLDDALGWRRDNVIGVSVHGLFENGDYLRRFLERVGWAADEELGDWSQKVEAEIERAARAVEESGWQLEA